ncbi:MAG: BrnT family toxin [Xanthomonadaceae bacterium]|jgi:hypothetical protein|nr:BrnT family toxin [Xanthomonadaceae bacterium]
MGAGFERNGVLFVWDVAKASCNRRKHGVAFEQAAEAFFDPSLRVVQADRNQQPRDALIGYGTQGRLLFVVHLIIEGETIRIVSALKATAAER